MLKEKEIDPTLSTYLIPPKAQYNCKLDIDIGETINEIKKEVFAGLLCSGILNVSQIFIEDKEVFSIKERIKKIITFGNKQRVSIPINPEYVKERLSLQEILADIVLYQLITGETDRSIILTEDYRTQTKEYIIQHNCRIYENGVYSIFDICFFGNKIEEKDVLIEIYKNLKVLFGTGNIKFDDIYFLLLSTFEGKMSKNMIGKGNFFNRLLLKTNEFLDRYSGEEGKKLFLKQIPYSLNLIGGPKNLKNKEDIWFDEDLKSYEDLIFTLKNIKKVLGVENIEKVFSDNTYINPILIKEDLNLIISDFKELLDRIKSMILNRIGKNILNIKK